jgi:hypothetical protein
MRRRRWTTRNQRRTKSASWCAYAVNTVSGNRCAGLGRTAAEAKASAWINTHWPGGTTSALVKVSTEVPDGWTFELYPPPKPKPQMLAISTLDILDLVRLTVPDVTADEVANIIMQSLPYMGGTAAMSTHSLRRQTFDSAFSPPWRPLPPREVVPKDAALGRPARSAGRKDHGRIQSRPAAQTFAAAEKRVVFAARSAA